MQWLWLALIQGNGNIFHKGKSGHRQTPQAYGGDAIYKSRIPETRESPSLSLKETTSWRHHVPLQPKNCKAVSFCWRQPFLDTSVQAPHRLSPHLSSSSLVPWLGVFPECSAILIRLWFPGGGRRVFQVPYLEIQSPSSQQYKFWPWSSCPGRGNPGPGEGRLDSIRIPTSHFADLLPVCLHPLNRIAMHGHYDV